MKYCTVDDLESRFGFDELVELTDDDNTGAIDNQEVNNAIEDASRLIDSYLGGRYALPLSSVPQVLVRICADITRYYLFDSAVTEAVEKRYNDASAFLKSVAKGDVRLGLSETDETAATDDQIEIVSSDSVFSRANSSGFI